MLFLVLSLIISNFALLKIYNNETRIQRKSRFDTGRHG